MRVLRYRMEFDIEHPLCTCGLSTHLISGKAGALY